MKRTFSKLFILLGLAVSLSVSVLAQEPVASPADDPGRPADRMGILRELGLNQDQVRQIRLLNAEMKDRRQAAHERVRQAMRNLDQAIYADTVDEALVAQRITEMQAAQAEISKINFEQEFAIRKLLTPEQLVIFRDIRRRAAEAKENFQRRRKENIQNRPLRRPGADSQPGGQRPVTRPAQQRQQRP